MLILLVKFNHLRSRLFFFNVQMDIWKFLKDEKEWIHINMMMETCFIDVLCFILLNVFLTNKWINKWINKWNYIFVYVYQNFMWTCLSSLHWVWSKCQSLRGRKYIYALIPPQPYKGNGKCLIKYDKMKLEKLACMHRNNNDHETVNSLSLYRTNHSLMFCCQQVGNFRNNYYFQVRIDW